MRHTLPGYDRLKRTEKSEVQDSSGSWFFTKIPLLTKRRMVFDLIRDLTKSSRNARQFSYRVEMQTTTVRIG